MLFGTAKKMPSAKVLPSLTSPAVGRYKWGMSKTPDVLIVGSGVIGLSSALWLSKRGLSVRLLDRGSPGREASWAGAGIVPPGNLSRATHPMDRLRAHSSALIAQLAGEIQESTGVDVGYRRCGGLELFEQIPPEMLACWRGEEIPFEELDAPQIKALCPSLAAEVSGCHFPTMAQIRNPRLMAGLIAALQKAGVEITSEVEIVAFETSDTQLKHAITARGERLRAGRFLLCPGAWGGQLLEMLRVSLPVYPVRGQIVLFQSAVGFLNKIVGIGKNYFVPRDDGRILAGATEDAAARFDKSCKDADFKLLVDFALQYLPGLRDAVIEKTWSGLRPGSPGGIPFIGPVPGLANAFYAGGHHRAGIQLSTGTALALSQLLSGEEPWLDLAPFRLDRTEAEPYTRPFQS